MREVQSAGAWRTRLRNADEEEPVDGKPAVEELFARRAFETAKVGLRLNRAYPPQFTGTEHSGQGTSYANG
jgi:hypothetical protein